MASYRAVRLPVTLATMSIIAAVAGCASPPSGGPPRRATGSGTQVQAYVQPLPPPPPTSAVKWTPNAVVLGFLHASASYAFDPGAAEQYLAPALRKTWHPGNGPVAVVGAPQPASIPFRHGQGPATPGSSQTVIECQRLAMLSQTGQYQSSPGNVQDQFSLSKINGVWLIDGLPQGQPRLLMTQSDFDSVYQARNLFFYAKEASQGPPGVLIPDPVYAPLQSSNSALNTNLATGLVNGLLKGPGDWLSGAASSAFPRGARLLKQVTIVGRVAQVDLGGAAVHASAQQVQIMEAQLQATLGDQSYSASLATRVQLYINHIQQTAYTGPNVAPMITGPVLAVTALGGVGQLPEAPLAKAIPIIRITPAQIGRSAITAIAAEPTQGRTPQIAVAVRFGAGCAIFLAAGGQSQPYHPDVVSTSGGTCTSLSWDNSGNLWAAASGGVWVLGPQNRRPVQVDLGALSAGGQPVGQIQALRMAPDSVRAALLVHNAKSGNKLLLTSVRFTRGAVAVGPPVSIGAFPSDVGPVSISWLDAYHLAVLGSDGFIYGMPLTGGAGIQPGGPLQPLGPAPDGARTLSTDGSELVVGAFGNLGPRIYASSPVSLHWRQVTSGSDPVYPG